METFQPKLIYLARRNPSLSRAQFRDRWRRHGCLGMSLPRWANIARYVHCDVEQPEGSAAGVVSDHDAIGLIWHKSPEHRARHLADTSSRLAMEADEAATFSAPIASSCLVAREGIVQAPPTVAEWKLVRFSHGAATEGLADIALGYVLNHPLPPENARAWGLSWSLVEEFWFATRDDAIRAAPLVGGEGIVALCREVQLYP